MIWRRKTKKKGINRLFSTIWFREQTTLKSSDNVIFRVQPDVGVQTHIAKEQCVVEIKGRVEIVGREEAEMEAESLGKGLKPLVNGLSIVQ